MSTATMTTNRLNGLPNKHQCIIPQFAQGWDIKYLPNGWGVALVEIGPDLAGDILATNVQNQRKTRPSHIKRIARDIQNGRWKTTHQGIALNRFGKLHDGQHRIYAIIESGLSVLMVVFIGAGDKPEMMLFDGMAPRTIGNASDVIGVFCDTGISSVINALYLFAIAQKSGSNHSSLTKSEHIELIQKYNSEAALVNGWFAGSPCPGTNRAPIKAAVLAAMINGVDVALLERFSKVVCDKLPATETQDSPARLLRLTASRVEGGGASIAQDLFMRSCNALKYAIEGKSIAKLFPIAKCPFPVEA